MLKKSNKELLIRIDERQKAIMKEVENIHKKLDSKLDCIDFDKFLINDFKDIKDKTEEHEKNWNRLVGYMLGSGLVGGTAGVGIVKLISGLSALAFGG
jgi:hypothetical protein